MRVLLVDDSVVIRRVLREAFSLDPDFEVAGTASNGQAALAKFQELKPDLVILDIEMPEMDGLETLARIRGLNRSVPVIMFSTLTEHGASATLEALSQGASDYVTKPYDVSNLSEALTRIRQQLIPKARALCLPRSRDLGTSEAITRSARQQKPRESDPIEIVAIGTSTGGPNALATVLPHVPTDFPVPILIVQHMPPVFTRFLAERLSASCQIPVREAVAGQELCPGEAWIAPGNYHMTLARDEAKVRLILSQTPPENSCRPSVDVLFRSVAETYGAGALAVVMTGMGQDGLLGCQRIHEKQGRIFAQDEASSVVWGMPGFVAKSRLCDAILPLKSIGPELVNIVMSAPARWHSMTGI